MCSKEFADRALDITARFDIAEFVLPASTRLDLQSLLEFASRCPDTHFSVIGHTDNRGSESYNVQLSRERAGQLKSVMVDNGIAAKRIFVIGAGDTVPVASNDTVSGRSENRRVEISIAN